METLWRWNNLASVLIKDITGATSTYSNISKVALQSVYGGQAIFHENGGGGGAQSNWNENNPEEGSYILNRPFYSEYEYVITDFIEKNTATFESLSSSGGSIYHNITLFEQKPWNGEINISNNYQLIWDDIVFNKLNDNLIQPIIKNNIAYFGNISLFDKTENGNDAYFCIALFDKGVHPNYLDSYVIESRTTETKVINHSYKINKIDAINEIIHLLDKKYLPEEIGMQSDWDEEDENSPAYIKHKPTLSDFKSAQADWDNTDINSDAHILNKPFGLYTDIIPNNTYTFLPSGNKYLSEEVEWYIKEVTQDEIVIVNYDGTLYEAPYTTYDGKFNGLADGSATGIGNPKLISFFGMDFIPNEPVEDYPFFLNGNQMWSKTAGTHTIHCYKKDNLKKIDKKYLPLAQPDWDNLDVNSLSYIQNRPFGEVPDVIKSSTYNFSNSGVNGIYTSDSISVDYIPEEYDKITVTWGQTTYNCEVKRYSYRQEGYTYIDVTGIGNPNLCIINNKLGQLSMSNSSTLPFFIDLTNKKVYSNSNQEIMVWARLSTGFKYLNSKYLKGELLPTINRNSSIYTENYTMVVDSSGIWRSTVIPPQDWNEDNPFINSFIFNKPCYETYENIVDIMYMPMSSKENIEMGFAGALMDSLQSLQVGKYYYINMNGSTFRAQCKAGDPNTTIKFQFGNAYLSDKNVADTGENFYIAITDMKADDTIAGRTLFTSLVYSRGFTGGPHIAIRKNNALKVKKLDSKYLAIDKTLKKTNYVADAKAVGDLINTMQNTISNLENQISALMQRISALEAGQPNVPPLPESTINGETLELSAGTVNNETLELTYGTINNELLTLNNNSSNPGGEVNTQEELIISGNIDNNETLISYGNVTNDGVWEV